MNIQADKAVPFRIVKRVMYSCGVAGYFNVNFAALEAATVAPARRGDRPASERSLALAPSRTPPRPHSSRLAAPPRRALATARTPSPAPLAKKPPGR